MRYDFARQGQPLSVADTLIAAVALENEALLATHNPKDFPLSNLTLVSFR